MLSNRHWRRICSQRPAPLRCFYVILAPDINTDLLTYLLTYILTYKRDTCVCIVISEWTGWHTKLPATGRGAWTSSSRERRGDYLTAADWSRSAESWTLHRGVQNWNITRANRSWNSQPRTFDTVTWHQNVTRDVTVSNRRSAFVCEFVICFISRHFQLLLCFFSFNPRFVVLLGKIHRVVSS